MHFEESGAYTGEVSGKMLKSIGVDYVIIGHSERRQYFAETDETVNKKVKSAFANGLKPIVCVGETIEQREQFIDLLWEVIGASKAKSFSEMAENIFANAVKIGKKINQLDDKSKEILSTAFSMLIKSAKNAIVAGFK